jgi:hypothetical protein
METIKRVLNELYKAVDAQSDAENASEVQGYVDYAIELLSDDEDDYGSHMVREELVGVVSNLTVTTIEDAIYELEVILNEL